MEHQQPAKPEPQQSAQVSVYRLQDLESGLYVRFTCIPAPRDQAPKIVARLTRRPRATRFVTHQAAVECFARVIGPAPIEIVRSDA